MKIPSPALLALQHALNTALQLDPGVEEIVRELDQKVIQLAIRGIDLNLYLLVVDGAIEVSGFFDGDIDTIVSGTPFALAGLSRDMQQMFKGDVQIQGDLVAGQNLKRLFSELEIEWEDELSHFVGGTAAHQLTRFREQMENLILGTATNFTNDTSDYLVEELQLLVSSSEAKKFLHEVDLIRADTDRLEARIALLLSRTVGEGG